MITSTSIEDIKKDSLSKLFALKTEDVKEFEVYVVAALLMKALRKVGYFQGNDDSKSENLVAKMLCKAIGIATQLAEPIFCLNPPQNVEEICDLQSVPYKMFGIGIFPALTTLKQKSAVKKSEFGPNTFSIYHNNRLVLLSFRNTESGKLISIPPKLEEENLELNEEFITFRCSNSECEIGFPLKENTKEKLINCPMCQKQTNIWLKLKRIQELKELYKDKTKSALIKGEWKESIKALKHLISEWEVIIFRPYKDISAMERQLKIALAMQHFQDEQQWIKEHM